MRFSIIIPVHNVESYVRECISSCVGQDFPKDDYEIIVVNDGTPDRSMEEVAAVDWRGVAHRLLSQENRGLGAARNRGLDAAQGEWIWFVDADDRIAPESLQVLSAALDGAAGDTAASDDPAGDTADSDGFAGDMAADVPAPDDMAPADVADSDGSAGDTAADVFAPDDVEVPDGSALPSDGCRKHSSAAALDIVVFGAANLPLTASPASPIVPFSSPSSPALPDAVTDPASSAAPTASPASLPARIDWSGCEGRILPGTAFLKRRRREWCVPFHLFRRSFLSRNRLRMQEGLLHEDNEFTPRAYFKAAGMTAVGRTLYFVRQRPGSITRTANPRRAFDLLTVFRLLHRFMESEVKGSPAGGGLLPFFYEILADNVNQSVCLTEGMTAETYRDYLSAVKSLPALPAVFFRSAKIIYRPEGLLFLISPKAAVRIIAFLKKIQHSRFPRHRG